MISEGSQQMFICTQCGECCKGYGGTFVSKSDISAIADYLGISENRFYKNYCVLSGARPVLGQKSDGYCIFWNRNCTIHPVKPRMCRDWPFIGSLLTDVSNWAVMADSCPGIRRDVDAQTVLEAVRSQRTSSGWRRK